MLSDANADFLYASVWERPVATCQQKFSRLGVIVIVIASLFRLNLHRLFHLRTDGLSPLTDSGHYSYIRFDAAIFLPDRCALPVR
jgi:hypothetical protein